MTRGGGSFWELHISIRYIMIHRYLYGATGTWSAESRCMAIDSWVFCFLAAEGKSTYFDVGS